MASAEAIVNIRMRFINGFVTRIYDTRSHVRIDLHKLREYCFNVNIRVMYRWAWEGVFVSGSYYLCGGRAPPLGRRRGIKSEREMIYPPITHRRCSAVSPLIDKSSRTLLKHNAESFHHLIYHTRILSHNETDLTCHKLDLYMILYNIKSRSITNIIVLAPVIPDPSWKIIIKTIKFKYIKEI